MSTFVIYSDTADGYLASTDSTFSAARAGTGASLTADSTSSSANVGMTYSKSYYVYEAALSFDTSVVTGTPSSAVLSLYVALDNSTQDFTANARAVDWGASLTTGNWIAGGSLSGNPLRATRSTAGLTNGAYNDFTQDASFPGNLASPVRLWLSSDRQESNTAPTGSEYINFATADASGTTQDPKLTIVTGAGGGGSYVPNVIKIYQQAVNRAATR